MKKIKTIYSIRTRLIVALLITFILPIAIFSEINIHKEKKSYLNRVEQNMTDHMDTLDNVLMTYIDSVEEDLNYLAEKIIQREVLKDIDNISKDDEDYIIDNIKLLQENSSSIEHIYLALENDKIYIDDESRIPKGYKATERQYYIDTIKSNKNITLSSIYKWEDENLLTLSKLLKNKDKIVGVLGIDINIDKLSSLLNDVESNSEPQEAVIIDSEWNIVSNTMYENMVGVNVKGDIYDITKLENESGLHKINIYGHQYLFKYKELGLENWKIYRLIDYKYIDSELKNIIFSGNIILILIIVIVLITLIFLSKNIYNPLQNILDITKEIKNGNYNITKVYNKQNEYGIIEDGLYSMAKEIKTAHETLEELAYKDIRLGIYNKNKFFQKINLSRSCKENKSTILLLDITNLRLFNERFGYGRGDEFLMKISEFLLTIVKEDSLFRYGGDEFAIILEENSEEEINLIVEKIHNRFNESWSIRDINYSTKVTIVVLDNKYNPNIEYTLDTILNSFEYTMKETKSKNLKTAYVTVESDILKRKNRIKEILDTSIKENKIMIYYQPINNTEVNKYKKMEALIRLKDDKMGIISPFEFISIAEETGQIYDIGLYILENVCKKIIELDEKNIKIDAISINISVVQFMNENFVKDVTDIINKYEIDSSRLIFEITESIFVESYSKILDVMNKLSEIGVKFALDDFGTGYSSLSYILNLPIDIIKIDKSFIQEVDSDCKSKDIIKLIVSMCKKLNLDVIVEGVETKEQLDVLKKIGCINIQGYYFSKPVPNTEINKLL